MLCRENLVSLLRGSSIILWIMPLLIILNFSSTPMERIQHYYWFYLIACISGIVLIVWKGIEVLIALFQKKVERNAELYLFLLFGVFILYYTFTYYQQFQLHKQDIALYENEKLSHLQGKIEVVKVPNPSARGGTDYLYHLHINDTILYWFQKTNPQINQTQIYDVYYLPHTRQVISLEK